MVDQITPQVAQQTEDSVRVLEGLDPVRVNPGMYIGPPDAHGLHHLVYEVLDNALDEIMAGRGSQAIVTIHDDGSLSVADNGGGIPVGIHKQQGISTLQLVMTKLNAGAKFNDGKQKIAYKVSGGLHGIGVSAVNALSAVLEVQVRRDGRVWRQIYEAGKPVTPVEAIRDLDPGESTGTTVRFRPDLTIMQTGEFNFDTLAQRFREYAYITRGATITLIDEREKPLPRELTFYFEGGVRSFVRYLNRNREVVHEVVSAIREVNYNENQPNEGSVEVEFAFQYTEGASSSTELSFANHINTPDGGVHQTGLRMALTRTINAYARKQAILKEKDSNFSGRDTLEGLTAIVSIKHSTPQFESQTKTRLINPEVQSAVASVVSDVFNEFLEANPREARKIIEKCMNSMRIRDALEKQRELLTGRKGLLESTTLPGKLADCSERDASKCEVFIVEGDSAGGCFAGDTLVALADGRAVSFETLLKEQDAGQEHFGYTIRKDGTVGIERLINARITKRNATVIRVTLDNGEAIVCTPDHPFMLRDGSYKRADKLTANDSLMPLYRKVSNINEPGITINGYEMTWDPRSDTWMFTHFANNPEALHILAERANAEWQNQDLIDWRREETRKQWTPEFRHRRKEVLNKTYFAKTMAALKQIQIKYGEIDLSAYQQLRLATRDRSLLRFDTFCDRYFEGNTWKVSEAISNYNHRIVGIESLVDQIDVYDIEVPHSHNFALASGVFVHNSAKQGRDRHFQAILPLRGKILNTERARLNKILDNAEIKALIAALGVGISDDFNLERLRYDRAIIMCDADHDGNHIRTLLLTFFFRYMQPVIQEGHLYIAQPPIFRLEYRKQITYHYPEAGVAENELLARALSTYAEPTKVTVSRYKGLGEMNPEQLWETTMDPARRMLLRVTIEDAAEADRIFSTLMGNDVAPRRWFITTHARSARLDV